MEISVTRKRPTPDTMILDFRPPELWAITLLFTSHVSVEFCHSSPDRLRQHGLITIWFKPFFKVFPNKTSTMYSLSTPVICRPHAWGLPIYPSWCQIPDWPILAVWLPVLAHLSHVRMCLSLKSPHAGHLVLYTWTLVFLSTCHTGDSFLNEGFNTENLRSVIRNEELIFETAV